VPPFPPSRLVEQFHLLFLIQLGQRLDKRAVVLKGGSNLRFFHRSIRYSEDLDLDVDNVAPHVLQDKVRSVLGSHPFAEILEARGIEIEHATGHEQTGTTQRWKLGLRIRGSATPLPTKIEFSHRGVDDNVLFESVDPALVRAHGLPPLMVSHYGVSTAFRQKLGALAHRRETQARDIFDLHHLIAMGAGTDAPGRIDRDAADRARANAMTIDFSTFKSQVLAYLPPEDRASYDSAAVWDAMVLEVVEALEKVRP
jgi:predicted nucleotidyltransferase component of viral defense system